MSDKYDWVETCKWCGQRYQTYVAMKAKTSDYTTFCSPRCEYSAISSGSSTPSSSSSGGCFIATAAYSTSEHPDLDTFRAFRDKHLLTNPAGKAAVQAYYKLSPTFADYIADHPKLQQFSRKHLESLAEYMRDKEIEG
ncbi:MAG: CFI-box-CTERM domain-containing protein [Limnothrix sp.]